MVVKGEFSDAYICHGGCNKMKPLTCSYIAPTFKNMSLTGLAHIFYTHWIGFSKYDYCFQNNI